MAKTTINSTDRIYVADLWRNQASYTAKGWKPYYLENGELKPILVNGCRNPTGRIFLMTDAEYEKLRPVGDNIKKMIDIEHKKITLYNELFQSVIAEYIIKQ
jgi:hypothetical protein